MNKPNLLNDINAFNTARNLPICGYKAVCAVIDESDIKDLDTALNDPTIQAVAIERALRHRGHTISANTIRRHRRGDCSCDRTN